MAYGRIKLVKRQRKLELKDSSLMLRLKKSHPNIDLKRSIGSKERPVTLNFCPLNPINIDNDFPLNTNLFLSHLLK